MNIFSLLFIGNQATEFFNAKLHACEQLCTVSYIFCLNVYNNSFIMFYTVDLITVTNCVEAFELQ